MYGLGVLGYECLTGRRPFVGAAADVLAAHRWQSPPPLPDTVPASLRDVVTALLAKDPAARPTASDVVAQAAVRIGRDGLFAALDGLAGRELAASTSPPARTTALVAPPAPAPDASPPAHQARERWPSAGERTSPGSRRGLVRAALAATAAVVAVAGAAYGVATHSSARGHGSTAGGRAAAPARHAELQASDTPVPVQSVALFGSADDHPDQARLAADGNASTAWFTQHYTSPTFGNLRPGVGLVLDLGHIATVQSVDIQLATPGVDLHVYAGADPATLLDNAPLASATAAPGSADLRLQAPVAARYWLVWFTRLAPSDGAYRAGVEEITLRG